VGKDSAIEWTDATWNPWRGCHKVSPGCAACYMFREQRRWGHKPDIVVRAKDATFRSPLNWPSGKVFTCSWSDFFIEEADDWRDEAWGIIRQTPHLTYLILTKRVENIADRLPSDWGDGWPNVWLMASAEDQEWLEKRAAFLRIPAVLHGLSLEPLLGPIDLSPALARTYCPRCGGTEFHRYGGQLHKWPICNNCGWESRYSVYINDLRPGWVIIGGESDFHKPRPMDLRWVRDLICQCKAAQVPVFVKQLGSAWAREAGAKNWKGANPAEWPEDLRIREFPEKGGR